MNLKRNKPSVSAFLITFFLFDWGEGVAGDGGGSGVRHLMKRDEYQSTVSC